MANQKISGMGVHHIALSVKDYDRSLKFYMEGLGCTKIRSWPNGDTRIAMLDIGDGCIIEILGFKNGEPEQNAKWAHLALRVDDTDAAYQAAIDAGAVCKSEPGDVILPADEGPYPIRNAFVYGPDEEIIEFFTEK